MGTNLTAAAIEAWASLVRAEKAWVDKVEERLMGAGFPPLDWYHVLYEVDRTPRACCASPACRTAPSTPDPSGS